jgi:hypothetical protein
LAGPDDITPIRMPTKISVSIADLCLTLGWEHPVSRVELPPAYRPFRAPVGSAIHLELAVADDPPEAGTLIFESAPIWSLYRVQSGALFHLFDSYPELKRSLFIPDEGGRARLAFLSADRNPFVGPALELLVITHLARRDGVILHGCGISIDGRGIVFAGESGAGKSTLARLLAQQAGIGILSDDRVVVRRRNGSFYLYGTPWHGDAAFAAPGGVELSRIFFIRHGPDNEVRKLSVSGAVRSMLKCSFPPLWDAGGMAAALELFHAVATSVPCAELAFVPDASAIDVVTL